MVVLMPDRVEEWSKKYHEPNYSIMQGNTAKISTYFFLAVMLGQVKTVTAECVANSADKGNGERMVFCSKLSTRVRGKGLHGEMSQLIQDAFEKLTIQAGKKRLWHFY